MPRLGMALHTCTRVREGQWVQITLKRSVARVGRAEGNATLADWPREGAGPCSWSRGQVWRDFPSLDALWTLSNPEVSWSRPWSRAWVQSYAD
jgi:hypothetical protein